MNSVLQLIAPYKTVMCNMFYADAKNNTRLASKSPEIISKLIFILVYSSLTKHLTRVLP